jgi:hypothetical protein
MHGRRLASTCTVLLLEAVGGKNGHRAVVEGQPPRKEDICSAAGRETRLRKGVMDRRERALHPGYSQRVGLLSECGFSGRERDSGRICPASPPVRRRSDVWAPQAFLWRDLVAHNGIAKCRLENIVVHREKSGGLDVRSARMRVVAADFCKSMTA